MVNTYLIWCSDTDRYNNYKMLIDAKFSLEKAKVRTLEAINELLEPANLKILAIDWKTEKDDNYWEVGYNQILHLRNEIWYITMIEIDDVPQ